jgi:KipI family sensor histidine kinase inhibitor
VADWVRLGDRAIRVPRPAGTSAAALARAVKSWPHVVDVVVGPTDIGVYFDDAPADVSSRIASLADLREPPDAAREVRIRVRYDGPDLDEVARAVGLSRAEVVALHAGATYTVESMGFAPGFAYLTGLDIRLQVPRRETPRPRVPAGALAIAAGYTAVYPFDSPGGWHIIGSLADDTPMFDGHGARLQLGDRVRFVDHPFVGGDA